MKEPVAARLAASAIALMRQYKALRPGLNLTRTGAIRLVSLGSTVVVTHCSLQLPIAVSVRMHLPYLLIR